MKHFTRHRRTGPQVEQAVRRTLAERVHDAPDAHGFAERVIAAAERGEAPSVRGARPHRHPLLVPLASAAAVVVVIVGVVLSVVLLRPDDHRDSAVDSPTRTSTSATPSPEPATVTVTAPPASRSSAPRRTQQAGPATLHGVHVRDLTFSSADDGWALASADCVRGGGTCTALLHTTDGSTWVSHSGPPVNVAGVDGGCATACATGIRFATSRIGYVYGPSVLYRTIDGGASWQRENGGALALESADGTVVRVTSTDPLTTETAANGSSAWSVHHLDGAAGSDLHASLVRHGSDAYVLATGSTGDREVSTLFRSSDNGAGWRNAGPPCPRSGDTGAAIAVGNGGQLGVLCRTPQTSQAQLALSNDHGSSFAAHGAAPQREGLLAGGANGTYLLALDGLSRTTDGGRSWNAVSGLAPHFVFAGFESDTEARVVGDGGATIWTTHDAGRTWTAVRFS